MSNDRLSSIILDSLEDLVALLDVDGTIVTVNAAWRRYAQTNGDADLCRTGPGVNYLDVCRRAALSGDMTALRAFEGLQALFHGRQNNVRLEYGCETAHGLRWYALRAAPLADDDRRVVVLHEHITDAKQIDIQRAETIAILSQAEAIAHIGSWKWDFESNRVTWSDEMFQIFGVDPASFDGNLDAIVARAIHPDDQERIQAANAHVLTAHAPAPLEYRIRRPSGEERVVFGDGRIAYDDAGRATAILGSLYDRTNLKRAEAALRLDDRRLNALFEISERAFTLSEPEIIQLALEHAVALTASQIGYLQFINPDQATISLYTWSQAILAECTAVYDTHYPIDRAGIWADCVRAKRTITHNDYAALEGKYGLPDGHAPLIRHMGVPMLDAHANVILVIGVGNKAEDYDDSDARQVRLLADSMWKIVQRKRTESRLRLQSAALEAADNPIVITDKDGMIEWVNSAYTRLTGYTAAEAIGQNPRLLKSGKHPESFYAQMWATILAGEVWHGELTNRRKDGETYEEEQTITPVRDEAGQVTHFIAIKQDISERRQREREQLARSTLGAALGSASSRADMLAIILNHTGELLDAAGVAIAAAPAGTEQLSIERAEGLWRAATGQRLAGAPTACLQEVLESNRPCFEVAAPEGHSGVAPLARQPALACIPLSVNRDPFGILLIGRTLPFGDPERRLLLAVTEVASNALHRATLHEETARHLRQMQALHRIDKAINSSVEMDIVLGIVLDELRAHLAVDAITILRKHHTLPTLERAATWGLTSHWWPQTVYLGEGYAGQVALTRSFIYRPDMRTITAADTGVPAKEGIVRYYGVPLMAKGQLKGVLELFTRAPFQGQADEWQATLKLFTSQLEIALDSADMAEGLQRSHAELMHAYETTIEGWSRALDLRDKETEGHTLRVTEMTLRLARVLGVSGDDLIHIRRGALLHDIGKMGVPDQILLKPGPLTDDEWTIMRRHPVFAYEMLAPITFLEPALTIPYAHHERYDGSGYPRGLLGEQIPLAARIFAVVDVWDALRSDRPYRPGWPDERVHAYIREQAGKHFDPHVVEVFLHLLSAQGGG
jgi:PAS domain S-box-containing protein/putative nucleotidyltransferase with HDIG domain